MKINIPELTLAISMINTIFTLVVIPLVKWIIAREIKKFEDDIKNNRCEIVVLKEDFQSFKEKVVEDYVKKSEHNQVTGEIMKKLDKIFDILMTIKTNERKGDFK